MAQNFNNGIQLSLDRQSRLGFSLPLSKELTVDVCTLNQVHGDEGYEVQETFHSKPEGDWLWTQKPNLKIGVYVADCTALFLSGKRSGMPFVAAIHAGWRGTAKGIIEKALETLSPDSCKAWLSPSICQEHFEVGGEVLGALGNGVQKFSKSVSDNKFLLDLKAFQIERLQKLGVGVRHSSLCNYCQWDFVSYRRSRGNLSSRHLAWIEIAEK